MKSFVADAHALAWFLTDSPKLSEKARSILRQAEISEAEVLIPTIVLAELLYLSDKKKVPINMDQILEKLSKGIGFPTVPFDLSIFEIMKQLPSDLEIHDRIIAATGKLYRCPVITKDGEIQNFVETIW